MTNKFSLIIFLIAATIALNLEAAMTIDPVQNIRGRFEESWNKHDMEQFGKMFMDDARFINVLGHTLIGKKVITDAHIQIHRTIFRSSQLLLKEEYRKQLGENHVLAYFSWKMTDKENEKNSGTEGTIMVLITRQGDNWLISDLQNTQRRIPPKH